MFLVIACRSDLSEPQVAATNQVSCHVVEHIAGETCVPDNPQRIVALYTPPLASLLALGLEPIGISPTTGVLDEFPAYLADKVDGIEIIVSINEEPDLERILQLKPDLILGWNFHSKIYPLLSKIAPTLLTKSNDDGIIWSDWQSYFNFVARSIGKEAEAQKFLEQYDQRIFNLKVALGKQYAGKTISVAHISDKYGIETYARNSFPGAIMAELGLERPPSQSQVVRPRGTIEAISTERLDLIDGDILFALTFHKNDNTNLEQLLKNPLWQTLEAVQNNQVHFVDGWTWIVPNPLAAEAILDDLDKYLVKSD